MTFCSQMKVSVNSILNLSYSIILAMHKDRMINFKRIVLAHDRKGKSFRKNLRIKIEFLKDMNLQIIVLCINWWAILRCGKIRISLRRKVRKLSRSSLVSLKKPQIRQINKVNSQKWPSNSHLTPIKIVKTKKNLLGYSLIKTQTKNHKFRTKNVLILN